ncbi:MAG TPA: hypothetical protein VNB22_04240 [Pyrinomonadaceae bacterium]|jgi:hypothetical protein|nr:hypothetical protein [Pyrinomonadaceae bacterium]
MVFYKLDYTVEKVLKDTPTPEQAFLRKYLSADLSKTEAKYLSERIADHKWHVSERLKRDIGFHVAAVDYVENFYEPIFFNKPRSSFKNSVREFFKIIARTEFLRPKSL